MAIEVPRFARRFLMQIQQRWEAGRLKSTTSRMESSIPRHITGMLIPLLAGRDFEPEDAARKPVPLILNRIAWGSRATPACSE